MRSGDKSPASWLYIVSSLATVVAAASTAHKSTTITSVFCAAVSLESPVVASVLRANSEATEYAINCGTTGEDGVYGDCGDDLTGSMILTVGPSTMAVVDRDEPYTRGFDCKIQNGTSASCAVYLDGDIALETSRIAYNIPDNKYPGEKFEDYVIPLTITAGLEKLVAYQTPPATSSPVPSPSTNARSMLATQTSSLPSPESTGPAQTTHAKSSSSLFGANPMLVLASLLLGIALNVE